MLGEELLAKVLQSLKTCVLVNNRLCGKLFASLESPITFDEISKLLPYHILFLLLIY